MRRLEAANRKCPHQLSKSLIASMILQASGKKNLADFVGKWPPTFLLVGLYYKLLRPVNENAMGRKHGEEA